jgi:hypothetical protein
VTDEIEAIRARHEEAEQDNNSDWAADHGARAHFDRETLLRLLDAARAELRDVREAALSAWGLLDDPSCPVTGLDETRRARAILAAALKAPPTRAQALDELVAISQEAGLYDDPPPTRAQGESS